MRVDRQSINKILLSLFAALLAFSLADWASRPSPPVLQPEPSILSLAFTENSVGLRSRRTPLGVEVYSLNLETSNEDPPVLELEELDRRFYPVSDGLLYEMLVGNELLLIGRLGQMVSLPRSFSTQVSIEDSHIQNLGSFIKDVFPISENASWRKAIPAATERPLIVIDPVHGGSDPGDVSPLGFSESDLMLLSALELQSQLEKRGVRAILTRADDESRSRENRVGELWSNRAYLFVTLETATYLSPELGGVYATFLNPEETPDSRWIQPERTKKWGQLYVDQIRSSFETYGLAAQTEPVSSAQLLVTGIAPSLLVTLGDLENPSDELRLANRMPREQLMSILADAIVGEFDELKQDIGHAVFVLDDEGQFIIPKTG